MNESAKRKPVRYLVATVIVAVLLVGGVYGYLKMTALDRLIDDYQRYANPSRGQADFSVKLYQLIYGSNAGNFMAEHGDDPRVTDFFRRELEKLSAGRSGSYEITLATIHKAFSKKAPTIDKELLRDWIGAFFNPKGRRYGRIDTGSVDICKAPYSNVDWIPDCKNNPEVTAAMMDYLQRVIGKRNATEDFETTFLLVFKALANRGAVKDALVQISDMPQAPMAIARFHVTRAFWLEDAFRSVVQKSRLDPRITKGFIDLFIEDANSEKPLSLPHFLCLSDELLHRSFKPEPSYAAALIAQSIRRNLYECKELIYALGKMGAPLFAAQAGTAQDPRSKRLAMQYAQELQLESNLSTGEILNSVQNDEEWRWHLSVGPETDKQKSPMALSRPASMRINRARQTLLDRRDEPSIAEFRKGYHSRDPAVVYLCATLLAHIEPERFANSMIQSLDTFRATAWKVLNHKIKRPSDEWSDYWYRGWAISSGLMALADVPLRNLEYMMPHILALSCPDREFSKYATRVLREKLTGDQFADALFGFLARRDSFLVAEVDIYVAALAGYKDIAPAVARNLEILLGRVDNKPDSVFWIYKVIAITALDQTGSPRQIPLLKIYAKDKGRYIRRTTTASAASDPGEETLYFSDLAKSAIQSILDRAR
jgi:hypothetical protein